MVTSKDNDNNILVKDFLFFSMFILSGTPYYSIIPNDKCHEDHLDVWTHSEEVIVTFVSCETSYIGLCPFELVKHRKG